MRRLTAEAEDSEDRGHTNFTERVVNVDPRYQLAERVHILVHELGHIRCDHEDRRDVSRGQRETETEAESVAFIVCTVLGLELGAVAVTYISGWTDGDPDTVTAAQAAIHTAARSLLAELEDHQAEPNSTTSTVDYRGGAPPPAGLAVAQPRRHFAVAGPSRTRARAIRSSPRLGDRWTGTGSCRRTGSCCQLSSRRPDRQRSSSNRR